jgi:hypothetical protein
MKKKYGCLDKLPDGGRIGLTRSSGKNVRQFRSFTKSVISEEENLNITD